MRAVENKVRECHCAAILVAERVFEACLLRNQSFFGMGNISFEKSWQGLRNRWVFLQKKWDKNGLGFKA